MSRTETTMMRKKTTYLICTLALGCTGTDYIADPPMMMEVDLQPTLVVTPDMAAVEVGSSQALEAVYLDEMGMTVADVSITWMVSDQNIATIDTAGVVAGLSAGQVSVTAQVGDTVSEPVVIAVVSDPDVVAIVRITPSTVELTLDETRQLTARSSNSRGETLETSPTWRSSDEAIATVDETGQVTAIAAGQAEISAEAEGVTSNRVRVTVFGAGRMGVFQPNPDSDYRCEGTAVLQVSASGGLEVVFSNDFLVNRGPRLSVFLSTINIVGPGSLELSPIQEFSGAQTYSVPSGTDIDDFDWVIIHCVPFNISFGWAQLQ